MASYSGEVYELQASDVIIDSATDSDEEHVVEVILDEDDNIVEASITSADAYF